MINEKKPSVPRLIFTDEDRQMEELQKPMTQVEKAANKRDRMKARIRQEYELKRKPAMTRSATASVGGSDDVPNVPRLLFVDDADVKPPGKIGQSIVAKTVSSEIHRQIAQDEEENTGLRALHTTEQTGERTLHAARQIRQSALQHDHKKLMYAEKKLDRANIHFYQREQEVKHPEHTSSNPLSRAYQRRAIRREYMAAKAGRSTGSVYGAGRNAQKAVKKTAEASEAVISFVAKKKHILVILALGAMMMFLLNAMSSCTPLLEAGMQAFVMGTYPAEERDVKAAERAYKSKEDTLERELERYEHFHPGYDEYLIEAEMMEIKA